MVIGVISEDYNDCNAISVIIRKILGEQIDIVCASGSGKDAIIHQKKRFVSKMFNFNCEAVIIIRDSDGGDICEITKSLKKAYSTTPISSICKICITVEELEAWFLGDIDCIRCVYGLPQDSHRISESNVDRIRDPKEKLKSYVNRESDGKAQYIPSDTIRMAEAIDINRILDSSTSFCHFHETILTLRTPFSV